MILLILPNQLFPIKLLPLKDITLIYIVEEPRYFTDYDFHKLKLMYHRASMKKYTNQLSKKIKCIYKEYKDVNNHLYDSLNKESTFYFNPVDHKLESKFNRHLSKATKLENINFLLTPTEVEEHKNEFYRNNKYSHDLFYKFQRKKLDILIHNDKPVGGKWSFDTENRLALPKDIKLPKIPIIKKDKYYTEAVHYINKNFPDNYGSTEEWPFPIDTNGAIKWLKNFMGKRLGQFGPYEDATLLDATLLDSTDNPFLFHSVLSPMMNIGILPDKMVIKITTEYYNKHKKTIPIASYEGFIRQVIGWRNYVYSIYILEPDMYNDNKLKHHRKLNKKYWLGTTGIDPIDILIKKIVKYSYTHHIERLMYLSNWLLINQIDPKEVHRIFMEWTVDAYDWVMTPNVMGMGQYADGGKMMTRMYFSSSNYILKMSNMVKGDWCEIWDAIYYSFINKHYDLLKHNYATSRQVAHWKKKSPTEKKKILEIAKNNT
jgi:deoxyribodipyrimidine photolyase-related protein